MYYYNIFQQLFKFIPRYRFDNKADETSGNRYCKHFSAWRQFLTCLYALSNGKMSDIRAAKENIAIVPDSSDTATP